MHKKEISAIFSPFSFCIRVAGDAWKNGYMEKEHDQRNVRDK